MSPSPLPETGTLVPVALLFKTIQTFEKLGPHGVATRPGEGLEGAVSKEYGMAALE